MPIVDKICEISHWVSDGNHVLTYCGRRTDINDPFVSHVKKATCKKCLDAKNSIKKRYGK
jgi:hypothetical protein